MSAVVSSESLAPAPVSRAGTSAESANYRGRTPLGSNGDAGELPIGEMARQYQVSLRTLRFYEDRGLLAPRRDGTSRYYGASDRLRLQMILKGKHLGFTLAEISDLIGAKASADETDFEKRLQPEQIVSQISHLERQRAEIDDAIGRLRETYERLEVALAPA